MSLFYRAEAIKKANGAPFPEEVGRSCSNSFSIWAWWIIFVPIFKLFRTISSNWYLWTLAYRNFVSGLFNCWWHLITCMQIIFCTVMSRWMISLSSTTGDDMLLGIWNLWLPNLYWCLYIHMGCSVQIYSWQKIKIYV